MRSPSLTQILHFQECDIAVTRLSANWEAIPGEIEAVKASIAEENAKVAALKDRLHQAGLRRKEFEGQIADLESQIHKYKTQQIYVKKPEEYTAFDEQISSARLKISDLEDLALEVIEEIDQFTASLASLEAEREERLDFLKGVITDWEKKAVKLQQDLASAKSLLEKVAASTPQDKLEVYNRLKQQGKRSPCIVPLSGPNCSGCHMKVSGDTVQKTQKGELAPCDQCGRLLYMDS